MTNPLEDVKLRADTLKTTIRAISGAPSVGFRDVLSTTISNIAGKMVSQMQGQQQPQTSQPSGQTNLTHPQPPSTQHSQGLGSRNRVLGTIFRGLFGQRSQQGIQQQQPVQSGDAQGIQKGQPDVAQIERDLQDAQTQEEERIRRNRRMQKMGVVSGDDRF